MRALLICPVIALGVAFLVGWLSDAQIYAFEERTGTVLTRGEHEMPLVHGGCGFLIALWLSSSSVMFFCSPRKEALPLKGNILLSAGKGCLCVLGFVSSVLLLAWVVKRAGG